MTDETVGVLVWVEMDARQALHMLDALANRLLPCGGDCEQIPEAVRLIRSAQDRIRRAVEVLAAPIAIADKMRGERDEVEPPF